MTAAATAASRAADHPNPNGSSPSQKSISSDVSNPAHGTSRAARMDTPLHIESGNWGRVMDRFIHEQNLLHYSNVLSATTDPAKRQMILKLLAEERERVRPPPGIKST